MPFLTFAIQGKRHMRMRIKPLRREIVCWAVAPLVLLALAAPAHAKVVTLRCTWPTGGTPPTITSTNDVDMSHRTVTIGAQVFSAEISDRYVTWALPSFNGHVYSRRLDRRTGVVESEYDNAGFGGDIGHCVRVQGNVM